MYEDNRYRIYKAFDNSWYAEELTEVVYRGNFGSQNRQKHWHKIGGPFLYESAAKECVAKKAKADKEECLKKTFTPDYQIFTVDDLV